MALSISKVVGGPVANVTIGDVAREAGVALGTVSNVLNHPEKVRPETIKLVNDAINRLGYAPNQSARVLAGGENRMFGLVLPRLNHGFCLQVATGATAAAAKAGYGLLVASCAGDESQVAAYRRYFAGTQLSGMLILAEDHTVSLAAPAPGIPLVYLNVKSDRAGYFVCSDNHAEGSLIVNHLAKQGAERICVIGRPATAVLRARAEGIQRAEDLYPHIDFDYIEEGDAAHPEDGARIARSILQGSTADRPDAILGLSDLLAAGAMTQLRDAGIAVPDEMLVAGCDGNPLAWSAGITLTTCAPTGYELGRRGVKHLVEQVELAKSDPARASYEETQSHIDQVKPFILARASTGAASAEHSELDLSQLNLGLFL